MEMLISPLITELREKKDKERNQGKKKEDEKEEQ